MNTERISGVYARALLEMGAEAGTLDAVGVEMALWHQAIRGSPEFRAFLATPKIPPAGKMDVVRRAFAGSLSEGFFGFIGVVLEKRRGLLFHEIAKIFRIGLDERMGRSSAVVRTALPLVDEVAARLRATLESKLGVNIVLDGKVDPSVIGGLWVRVGDKVLDGTVLTRLRTFRRLMGAGKLRSEVAYED